MELSVFNDASKDKSMTVIEKWKVKLEDSGILVVIGGHDSPSPRGVGYSKNQAIAQSSGAYLCFLDADDVMMPQRVRLQQEAAAQHPRSEADAVNAPDDRREGGICPESPRT
nr:UDP-GlcNAc:betaGal beta-1,3-N-acetylglucosaminyltransferase-like protein 1 [Loxodonta africana]